MTTPTCEGCGKCCENQSSPPFMPDERLELPIDLQQELTDYLWGGDFDDTRACLWLDHTTKQCKHYEFRPGVCRDYPLSGPACHRERVAVGLTIEGWPLVEDEDDDGGVA